MLNKFNQLQRAEDGICFGQKKLPWLVNFCFVRREPAEAGDDDPVAAQHAECAGAVHLDCSAPRRGGQGIRNQAFPVGHVPHMDLLVRRNADQFQQRGIDRHAPFIRRIGRGDTSQMQLGEEVTFLHEAPLVEHPD